MSGNKVLRQNFLKETTNVERAAEIESKVSSCFILSRSFDSDSNHFSYFFYISRSSRWRVEGGGGNRQQHRHHHHHHFDTPDELIVSRLPPLSLSSSPDYIFIYFFSASFLLLFFSASSSLFRQFATPFFIFDYFPHNLSLSPSLPLTLSLS